MSNELATRAMEIPAQAAGSNWEILHLAWRRKWIISFVTFLGTGLGYLFFLKQTPVYESSVQVLIVKKEANYDMSKVDVSSSYDTTHQSLIRSPIVLKKAITNQSHNLVQLPTFHGINDPLLIMSENLTVTGETNDRTSGSILKLAYASHHPQDCPKVLNAIIEAYQKFLGETYQNVSEEAIELFTKARVDLDEQLSDIADQYGEFRKLAPPLFNAELGTSIHADRLTKIEAMRSAKVIENSNLQTTIDALESAIKRGVNSVKDLRALNLIVERHNQNQTLSHTDALLESSLTDDLMHKHLYPVLLEHEMLRQIYGPDHPKVKLAQRKIDVTREQLNTQKAEHIDVSLVDNREFYEVYLESLRTELEVNKRTILKMDQLFEEEKQSTLALDSYMIENSAFRSEIERKKKFFDAVISQLEEISLVKDVGGATLLPISKPKIGSQVRPSLAKTLLGSTVLGLCLGFGLAYAVDLSDRRFRSPDEIRETLQIPVIGHIPVIQDAKSKKQSASTGDKSVSHSLAAFHHPRGRIAEAYRAVRTALFFSTGGGSHQVLQITSPSPGDGKSTTAANVAVSIAQSGKKVLLIDADFRRPRCHNLFNADNSVGMSTVISGDIELADAIQSTPVENLSLLPCGKRPPNPAELLSSKRFEELVSVLREKFEIVIIDTPPVLAVTDPLNVAPRVDGVLLVLRLTKSARSAASRALNTLEGMGVNVLGLVVNGVSKTGGYGGYSYGAYGRGYRYGGAGSYGGYGYRQGGVGYGDVGYGGDDDDTNYYSSDSDEHVTTETTAKRPVNRINGTHNEDKDNV